MKNSIRTILSVVFFILVGCKLPGQDWNDYQLLRSGENIPLGMFERISGKIEYDLENLHDSSLTVPQWTQIAVRSNILSDKLFRSGLVLFDDPVGQYLNQIKDYLLKDDPAAQQNIKVFLVRSPEVNAFASVDGYIFVHLGLLAKMPDEATLAFILSHEIQHIQARHSIKDFQHADSLKASYDIRKNDELELLVSTKNYFSRSQELEADSLGFLTFRTSGYPLHALDGAMTLLAESHLPLMFRSWDYSVLAYGSVDYPEAFWLDSIPEIEIREDGDEKHSTHPNVQARRQKLDSLRQSATDKPGNLPGQEYLFGKEKFLEVRNICRFELCHALLAFGNWPTAFWTAYTLQQDFKNSMFLDRMLTQSLYRLAKLYTARNKGKMLKWGEKQGEQAYFYAFLEEVYPDELIVLALKKAWTAHLRHPENEELEMICEDLASTFLNRFPESLSLMDGVDESIQAACKEAKKRMDDEYQRMYQSVHPLLRPERNITVNIREFATGALEVEFSEAEFLRLFTDKENDPGATEERKAVPGPAKVPDYFDSEKALRRKIRKGFELRLDKVVYLPVIYYSYDLREPIPFLYQKSDAEKDAYLAEMRTLSKSLGLEVTLLDYENSSGADLHDVFLLQSWMDDAITGMMVGGLVNLYQNETPRLSEKYGTEHFALNGFRKTAFRRSGGEIVGLLAGSIMLYPVLPLTIYFIFKTVRQSDYLNFVFNLRSGEIEMVEFREFTLKARRRLVKSTLYNTLLQMQTPNGK